MAFKSSFLVSSNFLALTSLFGTRAEDHFHPNERGYADIARRFAAAVDRSVFASAHADTEGRPC